MTATCKHRAQYGENAQMPAEVSLEHFDECTDPEVRAMVWRMCNQLADVAARCIRHDHAGALEHLRALSKPRPVRRGRGAEYRRRRRTR